MRVCAFTSICEEDACWIPQYIAEVERLQVPFFVHFDRCSESLKSFLLLYRSCIGHSHQDNPAIEFKETCKQGILDSAQYQGFDWALAWDVDETYEQEADVKIRSIEGRTEDCLDTRWLNLWESRDQVRIDSGFAEGHRVKLYNLQGDRRWKFDHPITNGAKLIGREVILGKLDLVCLHHGMMTQQLREQHKKRWDRIYSKAVGENPYGFWDHALDPTITPVTTKHSLREDYL